MKKFLLLLLFLPTSAMALVFNTPPVTLTNDTTALAANVNGNFNQIIVDGNAWETNLLAQIAAIKSVPIGAVSFFTVACPVGWITANGLSGSPDTQGRYIRGTGTGAGGTSGARGTLVEDTFPSHSHGVGSIIIRSFNNDVTTVRRRGSDFVVLSYANINTNTQSDPATTGGGTQTRPLGYVTHSCYHNLPAPGATGTTYFSQPIVQLPRFVVPDAQDMMANYNRIVSDGNTAFAALQTRITALVTSSVPAGAVVPFNLDSCPIGWLLSNGTGGTADLRGSFPRSIGGTSRALGNFQAGAIMDHVHYYGFSIYMTSAPSFTHKYENAGAAYTAVSTNPAIATGTAGSGTVVLPRHVPLLYCQKQ